MESSVLEHAVERNNVARKVGLADICHVSDPSIAYLEKIVKKDGYLDGKYVIHMKIGNIQYSIDIADMTK